MKKLTLLLPLCSFAIGIVYSRYLGNMFVACGMVIAGFLIYWFLLRNSKNPIDGFRLNKYHFVWTFLIFCGAGAICYYFDSPILPDENAVGKVCRIKGRIESIRTAASGDVAEIKVESLNDSSGKPISCRNMKLMLYTDILDADIDDSIEFLAKLLLIRNSPNSFDDSYAATLNNKGFYHQTRVSEKEIKIVGHSGSFAGWCTRVRDSIEIFIGRTPLSIETKNFLIAILLGDHVFINPESRQLFSNAGIAHVLALSGLHIAIVGALFLFLLFPINFLGLYRYRSLFAVLMLWFYAFITGMSLSTVRACIMATFLLCALFLERKNSGLNALFGAALFILVIDPAALWDIGLQLSFICVASLLVFTSPLNPIDRHLHPVGYKTCGTVLATIIVTAASWVVSSYYFGIFPVSFLPANLLILPVLPLFLMAAIIYFLFGAIGLELPVLRASIDWIYSAFIDVISFIEKLMSPLVFSASGWTLALWLIGIVIASFYFRYKRSKVIGICSVAFLLAAITVLPFVKTSAVENGFIIRDDWNDVTLNVRSLGKDKIFKMKRGGVDVKKVMGRSIVTVDSSREKLVGKTISPRHCDYLIVAGGYRGSLAELADRFNPDLIVIHRSVRRKVENRFLQEAKTIGCAVHSIRNNSSLKFIAE